MNVHNFSSKSINYLYKITNIFYKLAINRNKVITSEEAAQYITDDNFIGQGGNARVYRIDDDYVLRVPKSGFEPGQSNLLPDNFPEDNFGQPISQVGNSFVLLRQPGVEAGASHLEIGKNRGKFTKEELYNKYKNAIKMAADMPQSAYDKLISDLIKINNMGYLFDPSKSNNLLIDNETKTFRMVDLNPKSPGQSYKNNPSEIVTVLIDNPTAGKYRDNPGELIPLYQEIIAKVTNAAANNNISMNDPEKDSSYRYSLVLSKLREPDPLPNFIFT